MNALLFMARTVAWLLMSGALLFVGSCCSTVVDDLARRHCVTNPAVRASDTRRSVLFVQNFVYVRPSWSSAETESYLRIIRPLITSKLDAAERVFRQNGTNVEFLRKPDEVIPSEGLY